MAILLYRIFYLPGLLVALPYFLYRMWRRGGYRSGFANRFGCMGDVPAKRQGIRRIWVQAVSVGELNAIKPLLEHLADDSTLEVVLTTTTSTGYRLMTDRFAGLTVWRGIFPIDFVATSAAAWRRLEPDLAILMEGELWPEHIHQAWLRKVPVMLINARLSDRSFKRHWQTRDFSRPFFRKLTCILAGSHSDWDRFRRLEWLADEQVQLTGNLKLDLDPQPPLDPDDRDRYMREFGFVADGGQAGAISVLLGSSTWPGEESALVETVQRLQGEFPGLRLLLVPRHAERRADIEDCLKELGVRYHFRTDSLQAPDGTDVYVADTTGELMQLTRCADLVFIGKSLPPNTGGQTPIESAALGKPMVFGPEMSNFRDIAHQLVRDGAARQVPHAGQLVGVIRELMGSAGTRSRMGESAAGFISANRGATQRVLEHIRKA